jgi:hypothetical protein
VRSREIMDCMDRVSCAASSLWASTDLNTGASAIPDVDSFGRISDGVFRPSEVVYKAFKIEALLSQFPSGRPKFVY